MALITITQAIGCDGLAIAKKVASVLNVEVFADERLKEEAIHKGLHSFQDSPPGWFSRLMGDQPELYREIMESVVFSVASQGQGLIVGHGSQVLLKDFGCAMHVLISGAEDWRIGNMVREMGLSREEARSVMTKSDRQNGSFFRYAFHRDWDDPTLYDLAINPEKIGTERAAETIVQMAQYPEIKKCSIYAVDALERFALCRRVRAFLMERGVYASGLNVEVPVKRTVHITGIVRDVLDKQLLEESARVVPEVDQVDLDVTVVPVGYVS